MPPKRLFWRLSYGPFTRLCCLAIPACMLKIVLLESTQALTLALSLLFFLVPVFDSSRNDRLIAVFMSLLSLGFILRELDVEQFDLPNILILLGSGKGRNLMLGTGLLLTLATALFKFRYYLSLARCFFRHGAGIATLFAGCSSSLAICLRKLTSLIMFCSKRAWSL